MGVEVGGECRLYIQQIWLSDKDYIKGFLLSIIESTLGKVLELTNRYLGGKFENRMGSEFIPYI